MDDLISRSALIAEHCDGCDAIANGLCDHDVCGAAQLIMEAPAVDAVEVVRCKDCKSWLRFSVPMVGNCSKHCETTDGDDYCSHGERRADDGKQSEAD